jgi:hypothetical protein
LPAKKPAKSSPESAAIATLIAECAVLRAVVGTLVNDALGRCPINWLTDANKQQAIRVAARLADTSETPELAAAVGRIRAAVRNPKSVMT